MRFVISSLKKFYNIFLKKERAKMILSNMGKQSIAPCPMQQHTHTKKTIKLNKAKSTALQVIWEKNRQ